MDVFEKLDGVSVEVLKAANVGADSLSTLSREDLRDLFPGPEHFLRRKAIWEYIHPVEPSSSATSLSEGQTAATVKLEEPSPVKILQLPSPQYVVYTDSELEHVRKHYFELKRVGRGGEVLLSKEIYCRLVRNTVTNMVSQVRAEGGANCLKYPTKEDLQAMAKRLVAYYPMVTDRLDSSCPWSDVFKRLNKRLQNIRSPRRAQGAMPSRGKGKRRRLDFDTDASVEDDSSSSTIILSPTTSTSTVSSPDKDSFHSPVQSPCATSLQSVKSGEHNHDSRIVQSRHYKTLQDMYRKSKQNKEAVAQLLDLEFEGRRSFIDSDLLKEPDRPMKIIEAYPCFKDVDHALDELRRLISNNDKDYLKNLRERWRNFQEKLMFYAVFKKTMRPPMTLSDDEKAIGLLTSLPILFPSSVALPKKMSTASDALFYVLKSTEDPEVFLQQRPLSTPVLLIDGDGCFICAGSTAIAPFPKSNLHEGILYLMAYYYVFHMTYPKCIASVLSVLQTEILKDAIHEKDTTPALRRAMTDWKAFIG